MKNEKKTHWLLTTILVLVACGIIGVALSAVLFLRSPGPTYASAAMVFSFEGAATGTAPNGAAFDLRDMACDEVLNEGLKAASLEGTYTPEQIRASLTVRGVYPDDLADQVMNYESLLSFTSIRELTVGDYHPTTFNITLHNDFDRSVSRDRLISLLRGIMEAYRSYFARIYSYGLNLDGIVFNLDEYDYPQQLQIIEGHLTTVSAYAKELYEKAPGFRSGGMGFNDISVRLNTLIDNDITQLNASLTINALTRDTDRLLTQYQYQIHDLGIQRDKQAQQMERLDRLIESYEKNEIIYLSTSDSLTKIDGNSSETYDALVNRRKQVADGITEISSRIATYELMIKDLLHSTGRLRPEETEALPAGETAAEVESAAEGDDEAAGAGGEEPSGPPTQMTAEELEEIERRISAQRASLEESIRTLVEDGDAVIADFKALLTIYNSQQINDQTVSVTGLRYEAPRLVSGSFVLLAIKTAGPIVAVGFMICMLLIAISRRKEEKRAG